MLRLDNAFFRSWRAGCRAITTGLERGRDGMLYFRGLVLTAPQIRLTGNGYRRRDGTFHFEGGGAQARYGPVRLVLDGEIARPTIDLVLATPERRARACAKCGHISIPIGGLRLPCAPGGSRLGAFSGNGTILLPRGGQATDRGGTARCGGHARQGSARRSSRAASTAGSPSRAAVDRRGAVSAGGRGPADRGASGGARHASGRCDAAAGQARSCRAARSGGHDDRRDGDRAGLAAAAG